jgi:hypothetical protein
VLVVSWLLERDYRRHRVLDDELPTTYAKWRVVHPGEIENWARHAGRKVNEQGRSDFADLMWQTEEDHRRAGGHRTPIGALANHRTPDPRPGVASGGLQADAR